jgi:hypothetical protein
MEHGVNGIRQVKMISIGRITVEPECIQALHVREESGHILTIIPMKLRPVLSNTLHTIRVVIPPTIIIQQHNNHNHQIMLVIQRHHQTMATHNHQTQLTHMLSKGIMVQLARLQQVIQSDIIAQIVNDTMDETTKETILPMKKPMVL